MMKHQTNIRTYSELIKLQTFTERFNYLKLNGHVGLDTFGYERFLNQEFYKSKRWKRIRHEIIVRDRGCDLGCSDREIENRIIIHHLNPIDIFDIQEASEYLLNPEFLICVSHNTHNAIHYGDESLLMTEPIIRTQNDMCPWKH